MRSSLTSIAASSLCLLAIHSHANAQAVTMTCSSPGPYDLSPGQTTSVNVQVTIPGGTSPRVDVYLLADTTGSMGGSLTNVQANANAVVTALLASANDVAVGVGNYRDFPTSSNGHAFQHQLSPTNDPASITSAINQWSAVGGGDTPEAQFFALSEIATNNSIGFRPGDNLKRIVVWFGDAPGHDPICPTVSPQVSSTITEASVIANLQTAGAGGTSVIAISVSSSGGGLNAAPGSGYSGCSNAGVAGQATRIATQTGGLDIQISSPSQLATTICNAVASQTVQRDVSLEFSGDPELASFGISVTPPRQTVTIPSNPTASVVANFVVDLEGLLCVGRAVDVAGELHALLDGTRTGATKPFRVEQGSCRTFGTGCPGSLGVPQIGLTGYTIPNLTFSIDLTNAPPGTSASLFAGTQTCIPLAVLGLPACKILAQPDATFPVTTSAMGEASVSIRVPNSAALLGNSLTCQWAVVDPASLIALSQGLQASIGAGPNPITINSITPLTAALGEVVELRGTNLGLLGKDLCIRGTDALGGTTLFRAASVEQDPSTGEDVIRMTVESVPLVSRPAHVDIIAGLGATPAVDATTRLTAPASTLVWNGPNPPFAQRAPMMFTPTVAAPSACSSFRVIGDQIVVDIPTDPCGTGNYPVGTRIVSDVHWNAQCGGDPYSTHYDLFMEGVEVPGPFPIVHGQVAIEYAVQLQTALDAKYGSGLFNVTSDTAAGQCRILISHTDPSCRMNGVGGKFIVGC